MFIKVLLNHIYGPSAWMTRTLNVRYEYIFFDESSGFTQANYFRNLGF